MTNDGAVPEDLTRHLEMARQKAKTDGAARSSNGSRDSSADKEEGPSTSDGSAKPQIKFADQVKMDDAVDEHGMLRRPMQRSTEEHIAFVERQRNPGDSAVLRIPGPRDADAGVAPEAVDESDPVNQTISRRASTFDASRQSTEFAHFNDDHIENDPTRRNITIAEPTRSPVIERAADDVSAAKHVFGALRLRKPRIMHREKLHEEKHHHSGRSNTLQTIKSALSWDKEEGIPYLSWEPTLGRNSAFANLTEEQREELGGIEYRSLKSLALILTLYFWGFWIFGILCLLPWIMKSETYGSIVEQDGQGRVWWGIFTAGSAFTDLGYTLTPNSMISFDTAVWPLLLMSYLIIIGNTGFPIMLRIIIWTTSKYLPRNSGIYEELKFLLDHPRRCFTLLFPGKATWWLFWILVILNGLDLIFFIVLDVSRLYSLL
jgi:potassium uptake Trk family protein